MLGKSYKVGVSGHIWWPEGYFICIPLLATCIGATGNQFLNIQVAADGEKCTAARWKDNRCSSSHEANKTLEVVWNMNFMTFHILGIIIPTDFHIFQRGSNHQPETKWITGHLSQDVTMGITPSCSGMGTLNAWVFCFKHVVPSLGSDPATPKEKETWHLLQGWLKKRASSESQRVNSCTFLSWSFLSVLNFARL
jgi:hypothetical protein